jgi:hypothetical protein
MGAAAPLGPAMIRARAALALAALLTASAAAAEQRYALLITGAPGGEAFVAPYAERAQQMTAVFTEGLGFPPDHVVVLSGTAQAEPAQSTQQNVRAAIAALRRQVQRDDLLVVVLMGHGTVDGGLAKFNLVGPDLTSAEWGELLRELPGRVVVLNTTGGSFPFLRDLAARGRIVVTATESIAQRYDTVFAEQLLAALKDPAADLDKNGRVSVWELFVRSSKGVAAHYERQGLLSTERALLDDTGDGAGIEAAGTGEDGALARATYFQREAAAVDADPELAELLARRRTLEEQAERLKQRKPSMPIEAWEREFEALMIELARVSKRIRSRS